MGWHLGGMALAKAVSGVVSTTFGRDQEEAEQIVDELLPGGAREQAARAYVESRARKDGLGAFENAWTEERAGMEMGTQVWNRVGRTLGQQTPEELLFAWHGTMVPAIRYPTVPRGTARLRITISASHTPEQISSLRDALA